MTSPRDAHRLVGHPDARFPVAESCHSSPQPETGAHRYRLETYYANAHEPTVLHFDSADEAYAAVVHRHKTHTGVSHTILRTIISDALRETKP